MKSIFRAVAVAAAGVATQTSAAQLQVSTGAEFSSGKYGETVVTQALVLPLSVRLQTGPLSLRVSVPWIRLQGPADITPVIDDSGGSRSSSSGSGSGTDDSGDDDEGSGDDEGGGGGVTPADRDIQGLGDTSASATWSFTDIASTPLYVDLSARVRLPTGSRAKGLGNGTTDYAALTEIGWDGVRGGVFISGGRRMLESRAGVARVDGWQASAGYWRNIGTRSVFGMQGNWRDASIAGTPDLKSVDAYLTRGLSTGWKLEVSGSAGLSDANPDYVFGLSFIWRTGQR
jgi:hypothetical protein